MRFLWVGFLLPMIAGSPLWGQDTTTVTREQVVAQLQAEQMVQIARIVRLVSQGVMSGSSITAEQEAMIAQISRQVVQDAELMLAEKQRYDDKKEARNKFIQTIVIYVSKGIAIVVALLVVRAIVGAVGRRVAAEGVDAPLGVLLTTRTEADALKFGQVLIGDALASGGTVIPTVRSIYRSGEGARDQSEAMVILKTTSGQLKDLIHRAEDLSGDVPEMIALSRSMIHLP